MVATGNPFQLRNAQVQSQLKTSEALICTSPSSVRYFTGFVSLVPSERDGIVVISKTRVSLIHSTFSPLPGDINWFSRYTGTSPASLSTHIAEICKKDGFTKLFIDAETMSVSEYTALQKLPVELISVAQTPLQQFLLAQRAHKDVAEVALMQDASKITHDVVSVVIKQLNAGMTELEVKRMLEHAMEDAGATGLAFPSIVAFGSNSALPHHQPDETALQENMAVLIDVGAAMNGYCSDMTRTIWYGDHPDATFLEIEKIVNQAYTAAVTVLRNSQTQEIPVQLQTVDHAARSLISEAGFGPQFNHTTGHGLGLDIHEHPSVNWKSEVVVQPRLVITVEPGIYLAGEFGYRYENTVVVTEDGVVELTAF